MDWQGLQRQLHTQHTYEPQTLARIDVALNSAREALQILAGHGHQYHLAPGVGEKLPEWPRKLYHVDLSPNGRIVYTEQEAEELGPGWFDTLQKAQFWDGLETQFNGRGGVPKTPRSLAPTNLPITITVEELERLQALKEEVLAFRARNKWRADDAEQDSKNGADNASSKAQPPVRKENGYSAGRSA